MTARIVFNAGESVEHGDFNTLQAYQRRTLFDQLLWQMAAETEAPGFFSTSQIQETWDPSGGDYGGLMRPLRGAGGFRLNGSDVEVVGGTWIQMPSGGAADANANACLVANATFQTLTGPASAASGLYRRDLIQARIVLNSSAAENRDSEDAVTGALTTSAVVKRQDLAVEIALKTGSSEGSLAVANDPSNLDSPDSGYTVIGAILVNDTGTSSAIDDHWDFRRPWGRWRYMPDVRGAAAIVGNWTGAAGAYVSAAAATSHYTYVTPPESPALVGETPAIADTWRNTRISRIMLQCLMPSVAIDDVVITRREPPGLVTAVPNIGTNNDGEVGDRISTGEVNYTLFDHSLSIAYRSDVPLWVDGSPNAKVKSSLHDALIIRVNPTIGDRIWSYVVEGWGGF